MTGLVDSGSVSVPDLNFWNSDKCRWGAETTAYQKYNISMFIYFWTILQVQYFDIMVDTFTIVRVLYTYSTLYTQHFPLFFPISWKHWTTLPCPFHVVPCPVEMNELQYDCKTYDRQTVFLIVLMWYYKLSKRILFPYKKGYNLLETEQSLDIFHGKQLLIVLTRIFIRIHIKRKGGTKRDTT